jgi:hypothetical protein
MSQPQRALFKIVLPGDLRKINAESNDAPTGGGARDIRFSDRLFAPVVTKMFPNVTRAQRTKRDFLDIRVGRLRYYADSGGEHAMDIEYWPPTDARDSEGRIARVPDMPPLQAKYFPNGEGEVFYLFIQGADGAMTAHFASEDSLLTKGRWNAWVADTILTALREAPGNVSARGWLDWTTGQRYMSIKQPKKKRR